MIVLLFEYILDNFYYRKLDNKWWMMNKSKSRRYDTSLIGRDISRGTNTSSFVITNRIRILWNTSCTFLLRCLIIIVRTLTNTISFIDEIEIQCWTHLTFQSSTAIHIVSFTSTSSLSITNKIRIYWRTSNASFYNITVCSMLNTFTSSFSICNCINVFGNTSCASLLWSLIVSINTSTSSRTIINKVWIHICT